MATPKDEIRKILDTLPDDATWEDVQYSIYVRERVERGRREANQDKLLDQSEVELRMNRWLIATGAAHLRSDIREMVALLQAPIGRKSTRMNANTYLRVFAFIRGH